MTPFRPSARTNGIRVEEFQGEVLVYDLDRHTAHCLNGAAVAVWRYADGTRSTEEIAALIAADQQRPVDEGLVWRALEELDQAFLLAAPLAATPSAVSRRQVFNTLGWAAAVPLVLTIAVPTPAFAQTGATGA